MPIKDVFLPLVGQPREPALAAIEKCVAVAADLGARITALALEEDVFVRPKVMLPDDSDAAEAKGLLEAGDSYLGPRGDRGGRQVRPDRAIRDGFGRSLKGTRDLRLVRNHDGQRQFDRQGAGKLGEFPCHRCDRDGCLPSFAPERDRLGRCDKDRHWRATVLGYDLALGG
jgi:hypothetical protein